MNFEFFLQNITSMYCNALSDYTQLQQLIYPLYNNIVK